MGRPLLANLVAPQGTPPQAGYQDRGGQNISNVRGGRNDPPYPGLQVNQRNGRLESSPHGWSKPFSERIPSSEQIPGKFRASIPNHSMPLSFCVTNLLGWNTLALGVKPTTRETWHGSSQFGEGVLVRAVISFLTMPLVNHAFARRTLAIFVIFTGSEPQSPSFIG